jgi:hypothetical protein
MSLQTMISFFRHGITALACAVLVSCGGTDVAGGVGSGGSGLAEGSVSGFGSVIVDGVTYEDTDARVLSDNAQGTTELARAKLGQRVRITHNSARVADQIIVLPQLRGTASSAADSNGWFQMLEQWVHIISTSDPQYTATVLDGLTTVTSGDALEVHGTWTLDSNKNVSVLVATRIEKLSASPDPVLISGVVRSRNGNSLTLDNDAGTTVQYSNMPEAIGAQSLITAWVPTSAMASTPWVATRLVDASPQTTDGQALVLGTQISARDLQNGTVRVQGLPVKLPSNLVNTPPALGASVQMQIVRDGNGWKATTVTRRQNNDDLGGSVSLKGSLVWPANASTLTLRDVTVSTSESVLSSSCKNVQTGTSVYLEITAQRSQAGQPLRATQVVCSQQAPGNAVMEVSGQLTSHSPDPSGLTGSLVVTTSQGARTFRWTASTMRPSDLSRWINNSVAVEYQVVNGENRLRRIKAE